MKEVKLAPLEWGNFEAPPKLMKISNTGMTAVLSGKWQGPRPFLTRGPISGKYVFSQMHFHWGRSFSEGSEHRLDGQALPLEAHVMFFKNVYESQDDAMRKVDGTVTIAYFFKLQTEDNDKLNPIINSLPSIVSPFSSHHMERTPLKDFMPYFDRDYFMYWGNVYRMNVLWIISRQPLGISPKQLLFFKNLLDGNHKPIEKNFRDPRDLNDRLVFYVNPSNYRSNILLPLLPTQISKPNDDSIFNTLSGGLMSQLTESAKVDDIEEGSANYFISRSKSILDENQSKKRSIMDLLSVNLMKSPNVTDFKYTLAKTLLELEKQENNDYGILENYIKAKYVSKVKKFQGEDMSQEFNPSEQEVWESGSGTIVRPVGFAGDEGGNNLQKQSKMNVIDEIYPTANDECLEKRDELPLEENNSNERKVPESELLNVMPNIASSKTEFPNQPFLVQNTEENIYSNFNAETENNIEETKPQSGMKEEIQNQIEKKSSNEKSIPLLEMQSINQIQTNLTKKGSNNRSVSLSRKSSMEHSSSISKKSSTEHSIALSRRSSNDRSIDSKRSSNEQGVPLSRRSSLEKSFPLSSKPSYEKSFTLSSKPSNEKSFSLSNKPSNERSFALSSMASHESMQPPSTTEHSLPPSKKVSNEMTYSLNKKRSSLKVKKELIANLSAEIKSEEEPHLQNKINKERTSFIPPLRKKSSIFNHQEKVPSNESPTTPIKKFNSSESRRQTIQRIFSNEHNDSFNLENKSSIEKTSPVIKRVSSTKIKKETKLLGKKMSERNLQLANKVSKSSVQQAIKIQDLVEEGKGIPEIKEKNFSQADSTNKKISPARKFSRAEIQKRIIEKKLLKENLDPVAPKTSTEVLNRKQSSERSVYLTRKSSHPKIDPDELNPSVKTTDKNTKINELKIQEEMVSDSIENNKNTDIINKKFSNKNKIEETQQVFNMEQELNYFLVQMPSNSSNTSFQNIEKSNKVTLNEDSQFIKKVSHEEDDSRSPETNELTMSSPLEEELDAKVPGNPCEKSIPNSIAESSCSIAEDELKKSIDKISNEVHNQLQQGIQEKEYCQPINLEEKYEYYESNTERTQKLTEDLVNNKPKEKVLEDSQETNITDECINKELNKVNTNICENVESLVDDSETSNEILMSISPQDVEIPKKESTTGIKRPFNFEKPSIEKDKLLRNDIHPKSVTFAQSPTIVFDDSSEKEYTKQVNWSGDDKLHQMKRKLAKRMGKLKFDLKQEVKTSPHPEGPSSSPVKQPESPTAPGKSPTMKVNIENNKVGLKVWMRVAFLVETSEHTTPEQFSILPQINEIKGTTKTDKEQVNNIESVRQRVQKSLAKLTKERQEYLKNKQGDKQMWKP